MQVNKCAQGIGFSGPGFSPGIFSADLSVDEASWALKYGFLASHENDPFSRPVDFDRQRPHKNI